MTAPATQERPTPDPGRTAPSTSDGPNPTAGIAPYEGTANPSEVEWHQWRRQGVGASDVAAIVGLSPWASPWSLWAEKVGLAPGQDETNAMRLGKLLEPVLVQLFHDHTGLYVDDEQQRCEHPDEPWMRCTLDGRVFDHPAGDETSVPLAGYEAKYTSDAPWDEVPAHYQCQTQWQMAVTGLERVMLGVLHMPFGRPDYRVYEIRRDDIDVQMLVARCRAFWFDHVLASEPPDPDAHPATIAAVNSAWPADKKADAVEAGELGRTLHTELMDRKDIAKTLGEEIDALEAALKISLRTATQLVDGTDDDGKPVVLATWNPQPKTGFDVTAFRADHPDLAEQYTTKSTIRVLRPKPLKGE